MMDKISHCGPHNITRLIQFNLTKNKYMKFRNTYYNLIYMDYYLYNKNID